MESLTQKHQRSRLGQVLVSKGLITEAQLSRAIALQQTTGQRLGEALVQLELVTGRQIAGALRRQRNLRLAAAVATALLGPLQAFAANPAPPVQQQVRMQPLSDRTSGLTELTEEELGDVTAQGMTEQVASMLEHTKDGDGMKVLKDMAQLMNPVLQFLDADTSMKDVVYDPDHATAVVGKDGSITLKLPTSIGDLSFKNIRVKGSEGPSLGSLEFHNIDLTGSSIAILPPGKH